MATFCVVPTCSTFVAKTGAHCRRHNPKRCTARNGDYGRCMNLTKRAGSKCWKHGGKKAPTIEEAYSAGYGHGYRNGHHDGYHQTYDGETFDDKPGDSFELWMNER